MPGFAIRILRGETNRINGRIKDLRHAIEPE